MGGGARSWYALASWSEVIEGDAFVERMATGRTTLSKTDILAVFQLAREELTKLHAEGCYRRRWAPPYLSRPARFPLRTKPSGPGWPDQDHRLALEVRCFR